MSSKPQVRLGKLLHSGALIMFVLSALLYSFSPYALVLGILAAILEVVAWMRWIGSDQNETSAKKDSGDERNE